MEPVLSTGLGAFVLFAFTMCATPGPNNAMLAAAGANFGFRRTVPHLAGIATGFSVMLVLVALGAGQALRAMPGAHEVLRWIGAFYLLFLAVQIARSDPAATEAARQGRPMTLLQAAAFQWVNPKAWIISMGAIATYTSEAGDVVHQALRLGLVFFVVSWPATALWAGMGAGTARLLRSPRRLRLFNYTMAGLLILSLVPTLTE